MFLRNGGRNSILLFSSLIVKERSDEHKLSTIKVQTMG
jgi:hypothetical protein